MAVTSTRKIVITYAGDVELAQDIPAVNNANAPGTFYKFNLGTGNTQINIQGYGASTTLGVVIIPPPGNVVPITLKGVAGDTGLRLHNTHPTSLAVDSSVMSFVLSTTGPVADIAFFLT